MCEITHAVDGSRAAPACLHGHLPPPSIRAGVLNLWELETGERSATVDRGVLGFLAVAFSPDGKTLATGGMGRTVLLWDVEGLPGR